MKRFAALLSLAAALFLRGAETLRIADATGSDGSAVTALLLKLASERKGLEVSFRRLEAGLALEKFDAGDLDVVLVNGGDLPEKYRRTAFRYAAKAGIAVVSIKNPLRGVSFKDLRLILDIPKPNWEVGGGDVANIRRYGVSDRNGVQVGMEMLKLEARSRETLLLSSMNEAVLLAENDPAALVWGPFMTELPITVVALAVDGVSPTRAAIRSGRYPLTVSRFAVGPAEPGGAAKAFLERLRSGEFAALVEEDGEVPVLPELPK